MSKGVKKSLPKIIKKPTKNYRKKPKNITTFLVGFF